MRPFLRVLSHSLRYRWSIAGAIVSALIVGVLWGVSIGTVYPFVEVIFEGETIDSWIESKSDGWQTEHRETLAEVAKLQQQLAMADTDAVSGLRARLNQLQSRQAKLETRMNLLERARPHILPLIPKTPFATLVLLMGMLVAATILKGLLLVLNVVLVARISEGTVRDLRRVFFARALQMDQKRIDSHGTTQIMTQLSHNLGLVGAGLRSIFGQSIREPLKMLACLVGAGIICWRLLLLSLIVAPFGALAVHKLTQCMRGAASREMGGMNVIFQTLIETLSALKIVRIYNREPRELRRFKEDAQCLYRMHLKISFYDALIRPVTELVGILTIVIAILSGAYLVLNNRTDIMGLRICDRPLTPSALFLFYGMLAGVSDPARKMGDIYTVLVRGSLACQALFGVFDREPRVVALKDARSPMPLHTKSIRFEQVTFCYNPGQNVLHNVSLEIPFGQTVALVGENGCGKSTLVNLLARFYDPTEGSILLDGINMRRLSPRQLRRQYALVTQDPILFRGTVWDNLIYSAPHASRDDVLAAAHMARVADFIDALPEGYDTDVGDQGRCLSGGQRQRVALARALLRDPRIMILDEATSQIDRQAESLIHDSLADFLHNRTTFLITHRLSSIRLAQRVILMDKGHVVGDMTAEQYLSDPERAARGLRQAG